MDELKKSCSTSCMHISIILHLLPNMAEALTVPDNIVLIFVMIEFLG